MGFGISNIINKYIRPALISWSSYNGVEGGRINVDVKISEAHRFSNNVTTQTMEDGSIIDEHVINTPTEITLQFEETNNTVLAGGILGSAAFGSAWMKFGPGNTFAILRALAEKKVPLTITTPHAIYENMVMKNLPIMHRAPYRNAIQVVCDLIQLNFSIEQTFAYKAISAGIQKAASANQNGGYQQTKSV